MSIVDLSKLPVPDVIDTLSFEDEFQEILARFKASMGSSWTAELESDPVMKEFETFCYSIVFLRARVNSAARAVLLPSSTKGDLDSVLSLLGAERLEGEGDDAFRERGRQAPYGYSTAGPRKAYEYHARSAHDDVLDARAERLDDGSIRVTVLSRLGDGVPSAEVLEAVRQRLNAEDVRPLNDTVHVVAAYAIAWQLNAVLKFPSGAATEPALLAARDAAAAYAEAQRELGGTVTREMVIAALGVSGVSGIELTSPMGAVGGDAQGAPYCTGIVVDSVIAYE